MFVALGTYSMQLLNQYIFFHQILGYQFRRDRRWLAVGTVAIFFGYIARAVHWENMSVGFGVVLLPGLLIICPALFFYKEPAVLLLLSVNFKLISSFFYSMEAPYYTQLVIMVMLLLLYTLLKFKDYLANVHKAAQTISKSLLFCLFVGMGLLNWEIGYTPTLPENTAKILMAKAQFYTSIIALILVIGAVLLQIVILQKRKLQLINLMNEKCIEEQVLQYRRVMKKDEELKKFRHDYKAHLSVIHTYLHNEKYGEVKAYVEELAELQQSYQSVFSGNMIFDAILSQHMEDAQKEQIDITFAGRFPEIMRIKDTDLCILFANAMENAYDATLLCDGERRIKIRLMNCKEYVFLTIENPSVHPVSYLKQGLLTTKKEKELHGIGTQNMKAVAEKYDGKAEWVYNEGIVTTTICLKYV